MGHVGRFTAVDARCYPRSSRVVVRTARGLELGEVLASPDGELGRLRSEGPLLRAVTSEDDLLQTRLEKNRQSAFDACRKLLSEHQLPASLIDVEQTFDGRRLFFYFLGDVTQQIEAITDQLAAAYEGQIQTREFAELLEHGCGPDCGTQSAAGGCATCVGCAVSSACSLGGG